MSTEPAFSPLAFPALPGQAVDERDSIRGHAAGYAAGRKQAEAEMAALRDAIRAEGDRANERAHGEVQTALEALERAAADFRARQVPVLQSVDASIAAAAIELAEAIVGHELSTADDSARAALDRAMVEVVPSGSIVRLHPQDMQLLIAERGAQSGVELVADATLERGDAMVELTHGSIDARVSASLRRAKAALVEGQA
jgi:flagellar assembly protein FliH